MLNSIREESSMPAREVIDGIDIDGNLGEPPKQIDMHNIHHYSLIYTIIVILTAIMLFLRYKRVSFDLTSISMPNLASPENVEST